MGPVIPISTAAEIVNVFPDGEIVILEPADIPTIPVKPFILLTPTTDPVCPLKELTTSLVSANVPLSKGNNTSVLLSI